MAKREARVRLAKLMEQRKTIEGQGLHPGQWLHQEIARLEAKVQGQQAPAKGG